MTAVNPTIARLDRTAVRLGLDVMCEGVPGKNVRRLRLPDREIKYQPGGKGVVRAKSYVDGKLDCEVVVSIERMERLMRSAV